MNKKNIAISLVSFGAMLLPVAAMAQMEGNAPGGYGNPPSSLQNLVHDVENIMGLVFGAIAVICFLVAGILFLTSGGNAEKVAAARSAFIWGIAGIVVGLIAFSIIAIVSTAVQ